MILSANIQISTIVSLTLFDFGTQKSTPWHAKSRDPLIIELKKLQAEKFHAGVHYCVELLNPVASQVWHISQWRIMKFQRLRGRQRLLCEQASALRKNTPLRSGKFRREDNHFQVPPLVLRNLTGAGCKWYMLMFGTGPGRGISSKFAVLFNWVEANDHPTA